MFRNDTFSILLHIAEGHTTDLRERLKKGTAKRHSSGSEGEEEEDGEKRGKEDAVDEEAENLDAELKHAMGNVSPKRKMQMYADEVEAELKKFRLVFVVFPFL